VRKNVSGSLVGTRLELDDLLPSTQVFRTGRSARADQMSWASAGGPLAADLRRLRRVSLVASPVIVEGRLWGAMTVSSTDEPLPLDVEERLAKFTELVATAIANADSRSELAASRRRIVAASDETRRRIERDLHDGTQQQLVSLGLALRAAEANVPSERGQPSLGAVPDRDRTGRRRRGPAGNLAWDPSRNPLRGWARPAPAHARAPLADPRPARRSDGHPLPRADRGRRLLRRVRGARQRDQARARLAHRALARAAQRTPSARDSRRRRRRRRPRSRLRAGRPHRFASKLSADQSMSTAGRGTGRTSPPSCRSSSSRRRGSHGR
jgi:hypothetical protein